MKYIIVLASGIADEPLEELSGQTPLVAAHTPAADALAQEGRTGRVKTLPDDLPASEEVALLSLLGYDPHKYFTGEAGLAVADLGAKIGPERIAVCHNLATESDGAIMDPAAGQISQREAESLLGSLKGALARPDAEFHVGHGFRGITVLPSVPGATPSTVPPCEIIGADIAKALPSGEGAELLRRLIALSRDIFREHDVNRVRTDLGENPATLYWPWGAGRPPALPAFESNYALHAAMVAGAMSPRGLARLAGMRVADAPGATGTYRTDYAAKAECALALLNDVDLVVVHAAAPADAGLEGNIQRKIGLIEDIDAMIVAPLLKHARDEGNTRVMLVATHVASLRQRRPTHDLVPLAMFGPGLDPIRQTAFNDSAKDQGEIEVQHGHELLQYFLRR